VAIHEYLDHTEDKALVLQLLPVLEEILEWHQKGTRYGIRTDSDGLLLAGEPGVQLTWMDAKVGDWVVTPRGGKAVEINALWFNALKITSRFLNLAQRQSEAKQLSQRAERIRERFQVLFFDSRFQYLCDTVDGNQRDTTLRPNQIIALGLPYPLLEPQQARQVLKAVEKLITPKGVRTLAPDDSDYHGRYRGDPVTRDGAYHQGTVWPWLLGPLLTALLRYQGTAGRKRAAEILERLKPHLGEAGLGSVSEIFDGDPPHSPRGCIAQAWSVAALLQSYHDLKLRR
jgi:predicted glycogen debranching enzyme